MPHIALKIRRIGISTWESTVYTTVGEGKRKEYCAWGEGGGERVGGGVAVGFTETFMTQGQIHVTMA